MTNFMVDETSNIETNEEAVHHNVKLKKEMALSGSSATEITVPSTALEAALTENKLIYINEDTNMERNLTHSRKNRYVNFLRRVL